MSCVSIFSSIFCNEEPVVTELSANMGGIVARDHNIVSEASSISGIPINKMEKAFSARTSVFNKFTHERERSIAYLKLVLARMLTNEDLIIEGFVSHLIPKEINHVLRVCLIANLPSRISTAVKEQGLTEDEALKLIHKQDEDRAVWTNNLFNKQDPWDSSLYDMLIPTDKMGELEIIMSIEKSMGNEAVQATQYSRQAVGDFLLSAEVEVSLAKEGHNVGVESKCGEVTLTINKHVLMLGRLEDELKYIANKVPGVKTVLTKVGPGFHKTDIYRKFDFDMPSKVLLVDDEREFVQTLSERLLMRDMGSAVAYDGESALQLIKEDEPDVMILDLRMPGIDGIEVLKRVKQTNPLVEVVILTAHGSEADKEICMGLGAFAYLQKPVDIDKLSETIKSAQKKICRESTVK
ncbi:MAG: response regulator [Syntrophales bacterium]